MLPHGAFSVTSHRIVALRPVTASVTPPPIEEAFSNIEEAFSKIKGLVRKAGARTREALVEAIAAALSAVTAEDVAGWFDHAGYEPADQAL